MKTLLFSTLVLACSGSIGFAQTGEQHVETFFITRSNVSGYGTTTIRYQLTTSQQIVDSEKLTHYLQQFDGVSEATVRADGFEVRFEEIRNEGQLDLLFERVEMLYLTTQN